MPSLLVVAPDLVSPRMAGPAIRAVEIARAAHGHGLDVTLAVPRGSQPEPGWPFQVIDSTESQTLDAAAGRAATTLVQGDLLVRHPSLRRAATTLTVDLYDPFLFESLRQQANRALPLQAAWQRTVLGILDDLLHHGDFFVCASERQRDFWIGMLLAAGRLGPGEYRRDATARRLIDVLPFGLPAGEPVSGPFQVPAGIAAGDPIISWNGGVWDWLDPLTLIDAVALARQRRPRLKLVFAGGSAPTRGAAPGHAMLDAARARAAALGMLGEAVFFTDWLPYAERGPWLRRASIGAVLDFDTPETRFAWRTRILDHIWAGLPTLTTRGSATADLIDHYGLGLVVPPGDVAATAAAIDQLLAAPPPAESFAPARAAYAWDAAVTPLLAFTRAAERTRPAGAGVARMRDGVSTANLPMIAWQLLRESGPRATVQAARTWIDYRRSERRA